MKKSRTYRQQIYQCLQNLQKGLLTSICLLLSIVTLVYCRQISGYFANYDANCWFHYFVIVERFSMLMFLISVWYYIEEKFWFLKELLLYFLIQDFLDRVVFDIKVYNINDLIGIIILTTRVIFKKYESSKSI